MLALIHDNTVISTVPVAGLTFPTAPAHRRPKTDGRTGPIASPRSNRPTRCQRASRWYQRQLRWSKVSRAMRMYWRTCCRLLGPTA